MQRFVLTVKVSILFALVVHIGCNKPSGPTNGTTPGTVKPKKQLISLVNSNSNDFSSVMLSYDSGGYLKTFSSIGKEYKVFYQNDTIHHVLSPVDTWNGMFSRTSWIFIYRSDKKCIKVLQKAIVNGANSEIADSNPFFANEADGKISHIDSLVYSANGQLTEICSFSTAHPSVFEISKFVYTNPTDVAPSSIQDLFDYDQNGIPEMNMETQITCNNENQPAYQQLWFFPFLKLNIPATPTCAASVSRFYWVLIKKQIVKWRSFDYLSSYAVNSQNFAYTYNSDSTNFSGNCNPDDVGFSRFNYQLLKQ